jgi:leucyl aminopeptidase
VKIEFNSSAKYKNLIVIVEEKKHLPDNKLGMEELANKLIAHDSFTGKYGEIISTMCTETKFERIIVVSAGKESELNELKITQLGGKIAMSIPGYKLKDVSILCLLKQDISAQIAYGLALRTYSFDKYKTKKKDDNKYNIEHVEFVVANPEQNAKDYLNYSKIAEGINFARDIISEPPNVLYPETFADKCMELEKYGVKVEVLDQKALEKLGMNALLGVAQGSIRSPNVVVMRWDGANKDQEPVAFVGKGVTFDSGGLSLKPAGSMVGMKYDMAGAAAVVGLMHSLAARKAKVNAIGVIGCVENMPSGSAQRPDDVVKSMSGQTIEILNTDAEGRLVLADILWYTQDKFKPKFMVNLATLTGAIVISLGSEYAGLFSNDDKLSEELFNAGEVSGEKVWRMPLHENFDKDIDSDIADVRNTQKTERAAGSIAAAQFLQRFVNKTTWAHLDIAGMAWNYQGVDPLNPKGATAFGIRLLNKLVELYYEKS